MSEAVSVATEPKEPATPGPTEPPETETGNEAKRYRLRLREAEATNEALAARLQTIQRAEAERLATTMLIKPSAIWAVGTQLADLLDEAGNVDPDKVNTAAAAAKDTLGLAGPPPSRRDPGQGARSAADGTTSTTEWADALRAR